jgi:hypothetical protein
MAKVDSINKGSLQIGEVFTENGNLRAVRPDEAGCSVDSVKYSGGTLTQLNEGVSQLSLNRSGFKVGIGNATDNLRGIGVHSTAGVSNGIQPDERNRQDGICPYAETEICSLPPDPCSLTPAPCPLDTGFRVLKLDDTNMNDIYYEAGEYTQDMLAMMESNIKPDRTDMDLLFGCLIDWGLPLSMPHTHEVIDACLPDRQGFTVHTYNNGDLIACFAEHVSEKTVREIAGRNPLRAVFRDSGFADSPEKINVSEIFKLLAPNTKVRVI